MHVIPDVSHIREFKADEILVTDITDSDWETSMKITAGIVTNRGGRTRHAAMVARWASRRSIAHATGRLPRPTRTAAKPVTVQ